MSTRITSAEYRRMMGVSPAPVTSAKQMARGLKQNVRGAMNKTETRYANHLASEKMAGRIEWSAYEPFRFRLADSTFACPDFGVMLTDGHIEVHEVKGTTKGKPLVTEAGLLRFKVSRETFWMFRWRLMYFYDGDWREWTVGNKEKQEAA